MNGLWIALLLVMACWTDISAQGARLPLRFEANHGQAAAPIHFLGRGAGYYVLVEQDSLTVLLSGSASVGIRFAGAATGVGPAGTNPLPSLAHYLVGAEPEGWVTNVPEFASVRYAELHAGVDLSVTGEGRTLVLEFVVAPGASVENIALDFVNAIEPDGDGGMVARTESGRNNIYRIEPEPLEAVRDWMNQIWRGRLALLKRIAEGDS